MWSASEKLKKAANNSFLYNYCATEPTAANLFYFCRTEVLCGAPLSVVGYAGREWFIGVQLAHLFIRETYKFYRSLKLSGVPICKCNPGEVLRLQELGAIALGIHSVTLVSRLESLPFLEREINRKPRASSRRNNNKLWEQLLIVADNDYNQLLETQRV